MFFKVSMFGKKKSVSASFYYYREVKASWLVSLYQHKKLKLEITWFLLEVLVEQIVFYAENIDKAPTYEWKSETSHKTTYRPL